MSESDTGGSTPNASADRKITFFACRSGRNNIYILRDLLDVVDRVRYTGILCNALVCEVNLAVLVQSYVLQKSVSLDGIVDIRLRLFVQVDNLCIAAALEVEYAVVVPAVLVVADQKTLRVCGKGGLTGSGKSEEDSGVLSVPYLCLQSSAWKRCPSAADSSSSWRTYPSSSLRRTRYLR